MVDTMPATRLKLPASLAERRKSFVTDALKAREDVRRTGKVYAFEDVARYYKARAAGKPAKRPRLKRWRG